jgi:hypothetical protein
MIKKYGGQFVESEVYDKKYGLPSIRWPESYGKDHVLVQSLDSLIFAITEPNFDETSSI